MSVRGVIKTAGRLSSSTVFRPAGFAIEPIRAFSAATIYKHEDPTKNQVHVSSYDNGNRITKNIHVDEIAPVTSAVQDIEVQAVPLKSAVYDNLTPTLKRFCLPGKVAVITGGGRGLGYNMAQALAESGVRGIAIFDVNEETGNKSARDLTQQTGVDTRFYKIDVRKELAINQAVQDVVDHYGNIDVLVNAAGIADSNMKAETYNLDRFRLLIDINLTGTFIVTQAVGNAMIAAKQGGSIINIASMSGSVVNYPQEQSCYNASKAGVVQLTKSLAAEWARHSIRVNSISPGYMDTALNRVPALDAQKKIWIEQTPQKRLGDVHDLNGLAVYLASEGSAFMTGSNLLIDGGYSVW